MDCPLIRSRDGYEELVRSMWAGYPDLHFALEDMLAEGDRVAIRTRFEGTRTASDEPEKWLALIIYCAVAGQIVEEWEVVDGVPI